MATVIQASDSQGKELAEAGAQVDVALVAVGGFGLMASLVGALGWDWHVAVGVGVGSGLAVANLWLLKRLARAFFSRGGSSRVLWGLLGVFKFVGLMVGVGLLLRHDIVGPLPLIVGYGALPFGITLSNFLGARSQADVMECHESGSCDSFDSTKKG
ncbi:MAG TPA: hypothetical protein PKL73_19200 [Polyangiaceae bacterium]|jgi:hypothetical protein|nr:MAG: hypothetical protein BWY17_04909 [Deltaproteobacteria bacterium ADurb.Bin207]HNS99093.1 hypothetical protein [Polyangiaceae bacterium]HNZ25207.1 hypothetical protein [Polyangiaceae bacterium]HOD25349.1 hypothetical protein [Polyangiaceae bacterium]HOE51576.1 hypothetical protein [Polyangiaceae bacterium]